MAIVSSHILDSTKGRSAAGIRCQLLRLTPVEQRQVVFDVIADHEGRISETVPIDDDALGCEFELVMHAAEYFQADMAVVPVVVIRFIIGDADKRYHMPVMLSPHSYSTWWSD
jgi:5-hydroxyisourate hydrolase